MIYIRTVRVIVKPAAPVIYIKQLLNKEGLQ